MKEFVGLRVMSLESTKSKEQTSALDYALQVMQLEVENQWLYENVRFLGYKVLTVAKELINFFAVEYNRQYWEEVLVQYSLQGKSKKEAETVLNAHAAVLVAPCIISVLDTCSALIGSWCKRQRVKSYREVIMDVYDTAREFLIGQGYEVPTAMVEEFTVDRSDTMAEFYNTVQ